MPVKTVDELILAISGGVSGDRILIAPGAYDLTGRQMAQSGGSAVKSHLSVTKVYSFLGQGAKPEDTVLKANGDYSPKGIRSPLYNAGYEDEAYLAAIGKTDCVGGERRKFDKIDIGAFEMQEKQGLTVILR